jgi:dipeptidyl aminopeptidase/acylaminoacyl peptidase
MEGNEGEMFDLMVDGQRVVGLHHKGSKGQVACVVACHGLMSNKDSVKYQKLADRAVGLGLHATRFDFRGRGASQGQVEDSWGSKRLEDVKAVVDWLVGRYSFERFGLLGSSFGSYVSLLHAAADERVSAVVCLAAPFQMMELLEAREGELGQKGSTSEQLGPAFVEDLRKTDEMMRDAVERIKAPTLMIHGTEDDVVPIEQARRIYDKLSCGKRFLEVEGGDHVFSDQGHLDTVIEASVSWFDEKLGSPLREERPG